MMGVRRGLAGTAVVGLLLAGACSSDSPEDADASEGRAATSATAVGDVVELRPLSASSDHRIVDDLDRDVILRGVNVTSLGEYWQGDADHEPTMPTTDDDWDEMAARGFSVIRLVVHWSRLEPTRGEIDESYLDEIEAYVDAAAQRGMYTVIDMHQDAYSAFIFSPPGTVCAEGSEPARGWDGAPEWATITDGLDTCITGDRNSSPAVTAAWNHFYDNTNGIRDRFVATWAAVADRFAGRPEVAGYNLLNEPEVSRPGEELTPLFDALVGDTVTAIRDAEAAAGATFDHLIIVEPGLPAANASYGLVIPDPARIGVDPVNIVAGPHNYAESIGNGLDLTIEETNELFLTVATGLGVPTWVGEYGFWDTSPETLAELDRFAIDQDRLALGGAWWQWRQPCGDPHSVAWGGWSTMEPGVVIHLHRLGCPGDEDLGPTEELLRVVGRGYPRAAPGRITGFTGDHATGDLRIEAAGGQAGQQLVVWTPTTADTHDVALDGLGGLVETAVPGGRILTADVVTGGGSYSLVVTPR